jgi:hypothetical protein
MKSDITKTTLALLCALCTVTAIRTHSVFMCMRVYSLLVVWFAPIRDCFYVRMLVDVMLVGVCTRLRVSVAFVRPAVQVTETCTFPVITVTGTSREIGVAVGSAMADRVAGYLVSEPYVASDLWLSVVGSAAQPTLSYHMVFAFTFAVVVWMCFSSCFLCACARSMTLDCW